jgi:hypothetical protein
MPVRCCPVEETCTVEQRRASSGAFYAALAPDGRLIARSSALDPADAEADRRARAELVTVLATLGWRPTDASGRAFTRRS